MHFVSGLKTWFSGAESPYYRHLFFWIYAWKKSGWKTANKKVPVKNVELWQKLDELRQKHEIRCVWVKGHAGHKENERCDELARMEATKIKG